MKARKAKKKGARKAPGTKPKTPTRTLTCKTPGCGRTWKEPVRPGRVREYCLERCSDERNRLRDLDRLEDRGELDRAEAAQRARDELDLKLEHAARPLRIAMALALSENLKLIAAVAGVDPESPELDELVEEAKALFPGIVEGRPQDMQQLYQLAAGQAGVSMLLRAHQLSPSQSATAIKSAMQAIALAQSGGAGRTFGRFEIVLKGLDDEGGNA